MTGVLPKDIRRCAHRKTNGIPCGSPALKDKPYCYFHDRWREQHIDVIDGTPYYQNVFCELPVLEDANAIQMALTKVFHMLLAGLLEPKFAKSLIYCLSIAAQNLRNCNFAVKDEDLGDNAPAREDQSIGQNTSSWADRPEDSDRYKMQQDKEDAELLTKQLAEMKEPTEDEPKHEENVEIQAMADEDVHGRAPHVSRFSKRGEWLRHRDRHPDRVGDGPVEGHDFSRAVKSPSDLRALAPEGVSEDGNEITIDLIAGRRLGSEPSRRKRRPKRLRTFSNFDEYDEEPTKKPKPIINLYDRLAQRREDYKKREGIM